MCFVRLEGEGKILGHRCRSVSRDKSRRHRSKAKKEVAVPNAPLGPDAAMQEVEVKTTANEKASTSNPKNGDD
jgi:hypothetical protein